MFHPFQGISDFDDVICRPGFFDCFGQHFDHVGDAGLTDVAVRIFCLEFIVIGSCAVIYRWVDLAFSNQFQRPDTGITKSSRNAISRSVVGEQRTFEPVFQHRTAKPNHVSAPVACDNGVRT